MKRPLTITEILALRAAVTPRRVSAHAEAKYPPAPKQGTHAEPRKPPETALTDKRPLSDFGPDESADELEPGPSKQCITASLSDTRSGSPYRTNTVNAVCPPFTVLLWNIENYGEHKSQGNLFANKIIRHVLDRLNVDLAMFLETQSVPSDVSTGLEYVIADRMRTSKEKKRAPGMDPALKTRYTRPELDQLEAERQTRAQLEAIGRRNAEQELLNEAAMEEEVRNDPRRESTEEDAADPNGIEIEEREAGDATPSRGGAAMEEEDDAIADEEGDGPQELESPIQAFLGSDLFQSIVSDVTGRQKPLPPIIGPYRRWPRTATRQEKLQDINRFKKSYSYDGNRTSPRSYWLTNHFRSLADVYDLRFAIDLPNDGTFPDYSPDNLTRPVTPEEAERLRCAVENILEEAPTSDAKELLAPLERGSVLTLKPSLLTAGGRVADRPARPVIGYRKDDNACYLLAVLQLLGRIPTQQYDSAGVRTVIANEAAELMDQASRRAADGTYASDSDPLPEKQVAKEVNYHDGSTLHLRQLLKKKCQWSSGRECEDACDALYAILEAFGAEPLVVEYATECFIEESKQKRVPLSDPTEAERRNGKLLLRESNFRTTVLMLEIPKKEKTLAGAWAEMLESRVANEMVKYAVKQADGTLDTYEAPVEKRCITFPFGLPAGLLIQLRRLKEEEISKDDGSTERVRKYDTDPIEMCTNFEGRPLSAFISHNGSTESGHYTAHVRIGEEWFHVDDRVVTPVTRDGALAVAATGYLFYYGPAKEPVKSTRIRKAKPDNPQPQASGDGMEGDVPIGEICEYVGGILAYASVGKEPGGKELQEWPSPGSARILAVQSTLTEMIGTRNVETYLALFRCDPDSRGTVSMPVTSATHPNIAYRYRQRLLSADYAGRELGYQDPSVWINGRCPYFFELEVRARRYGKPIRMPFLMLHAPYGMPAAFRKDEPKTKKKAKASGPPGTMPAKATPIDFDGTDQDPLKMRADAMRLLLDVGIPSYEIDVGPLPMRAYSDAIIAGDFNLDMCARGSNDVIRGAYDAMVNAGFIASADGVRTTLHPVETRLPADGSTAANPEEEWYGHAYDNIFVREQLLRVATTGKDTSVAPAGTRICGVVDVLDAIADYIDRNPDDPFFKDAEQVIGHPDYYHATRHTPQARAAHELERWHHNADRKARAYFIYRRYISDHLPVVVDLDIHASAQVSLPGMEAARKPSRQVIGIRRETNTCYLNAALQMLYAFGDIRHWMADGACAHAPLRDAVASFLGILAGQAQEGSYDGDGMEFQQGDDIRHCWVRGTTERIRKELRASGRVRRDDSFAEGRQHDAEEALRVILGACEAERDSAGKKFSDSSADLLEAEVANDLADRRPSPLHFFLRKRVTYHMNHLVAENAVTPNDILLSDDGYALEMDCNAILYLDIGSAIETLQQAFNRCCICDFPPDEAAMTLVRWKNVSYKTTRESERIELVDPLPDFLIVALKRFSFKADVAEKIVTTIDARDGLQIRDVHYDTVAIIQHDAPSPQNGHYVAYLKRAGYWWKADDMTITMTPSDLVEAMQSGYIYLLRRARHAEGTTQA